MVIWKFEIIATDEQIVVLPKGAQILTVQMQGDTPCLWALCDKDAPKEDRRIRIYGTGHEINHAVGRYISTFQLYGGSLVFHAFEVV